MQSPKSLLKDAIDKAGGATSMSREINIEIEKINRRLPESIAIKPTYPQQLNNWVNRDSGISATHVVAVSKVTGISCHVLRPDIFPAPAPANDPTNHPQTA